MEQPLSPEVERLLQELRPDQPFNAVRIKAARELGKLGASNLRVVEALITAMESDPIDAVREAAKESLWAPAHQEVLKQHPDLMMKVPPVPVRTEGPDWLPEMRSWAEEFRQSLAAVPSRVKSAYQPSGVAHPGSIWRVILGAILGIPLGYLAAAVCGLVVVLLSFLLLRLSITVLGQPGAVWLVNPKSSLSALIALLSLLAMIVVMMLALPFLPAVVVGWMASVGARWGKDRRPSHASWTATIVTFVGVVLPILILVGRAIADSTAIQDMAGEQIPVWGILIGAGLVAVFAVISLMVTYSRAKRAVERQKFCEVCQEYMKSRRLYTFPIAETRQVILHMLDWNLDKLSRTYKFQEDAKNRCEMNLWTCHGHHTNYLELTTYGKVGRKNYNGRLVFSANLRLEHVNRLASALGATPLDEQVSQPVQRRVEEEPHGHHDEVLR